MKTIYLFAKMIKNRVLKSFWISLQKQTRTIGLSSVLIFAIAIVGTVTSVSGQISNYSFMETDNQTYSEITGGSTLVAPGVNFSNAISSAVSLGFNFNYNGVNNSTIVISENGYVTFGSTLPTGSNYSPISGNSGYAGAITCYAANLHHASAVPAYATAGIVSEVRYETIGSFPNRVFVVQYKNVIRRTGTISFINYDGLMNMQIRLYEGTSVIETWYKNGFSPTNATSVAGQVGLRGASNTDYKNRKNVTGTWPPTEPGTVNTNVLSTSATLYNATTAKFTWSPPCYGPVSITASLKANNTSANITFSNPAITPPYYNYEVRTSGAFGSGSTGLFSSGIYELPLYLNMGPIVISGLVPGVTYYIHAQSSCGGPVVSTSVTPVCSGINPIFTQMPAVCSGSTINSLPTTSDNGIIGTWSPPINNTTTTTYTFTPNIGQCATSTTQTITITSPLVTSEISFVSPVASLPNVTIGTQVWTNRNFELSTYRDGTSIPEVTDPAAWAALTTGAWCYYNNDSANGAIYGKLYNWYAVAGIYDAASLTNASLRKQFAPIGWHVPSDSEWTTLTDYLGGLYVAGNKMKEIGTANWIRSSDATNSSGFTGLPGGYHIYDSFFNSIGDYGHWWSSTDDTSIYAWDLSLNSDAANAGRNYAFKSYGFSVRLIKD